MIIYDHFCNINITNMGVSKNRGTPKWMVYFMESPMNKWMIWGENPPFKETPIFLKLLLLLLLHPSLTARPWKNGGWDCASFPFWGPVAF